MRILIKGADFSEVSIGKVTRDLSFQVSANSTGVTGFENWDGSSIINTKGTVAIISNGIVSYPDITLYDRLYTDYIEVCEGMIISAASGSSVKSPSSSARIIPVIVCFNENKELLTDASTYAGYFDLLTIDPDSTNPTNIPFTVPSGVKYIKIQTIKYANSTDNVITGIMP